MLSITKFLFCSIKGKLLLSFFVLLVIALLFQVVYIAPTLQKRKIEDIRKSQNGFAEFLAGEIGDRLDRAVMEIEKMAALKSITSMEKEVVDEAISTINSSNHFFNYYFVMDAQGRWLSYPTHPELVGKKIPKENMDWVNQTFKTERTIFLDVVKSNIGILVSGFSTPVRSKNGKVIAILRGVFVVSENNVLVQSIEKTMTVKGYESYLVSSNGWLIARSSQKLNYGEFNSYSMMQYEPVRKVLKGQKGTVTYLYEGKPWLAAFYPIGVTNWGLIVHQPLEAIILAAKAEARFIIFIILSCLCTGLIIAAIVVQNALHPLSKLVKHIKSGAIDIVSGYPKDEIGQLAVEYSRLYSELYQSSEMTRRSETKFRTLFNNASDAVYIHDFEGNLLEANQKASDYTGYERIELLNMKIMDIDAPETAELAQGRIDKIKQDKQLIFEAVHVTKTGDLVPVEISSRPIEYDDQKVILSIVRDLTERKKVEDALRESHKRFLTVLDGIDATIYVADMTTYEILFMNKNLIETLGKNATGERCWEILRGESAPCSYCTNDQLIDDRGNSTGLCVWQGKNPIVGKWYVNYDRAIQWIDNRLVRLQVSTDITEIKNLEVEKRQFEGKLIQAQKIESIGTLAGGVAHDFNNLLMGIQGRASLMLADMAPSHDYWEHINAIEKYTQSAAELTRQLLGFARGGKYVVKPININELVQTSATLFGRTRKEIEIHTNFEPSSLIVDTDRSQMEQVMLNMYVNAWQAMPDGGELILETKSVTLDENYCKPYGIEPGRFARISVTDNGIGMDEGTRKRVFDPFFTTKEMSQGTGLGLASAYGIIQNHDGIITVYSEIGHGTTFNIYLPLSDKEEEQKVGQDNGIIEGTETILLVDDEEMILDVGQNMLERLGYSVVAAGGGSEALKKVNDLGDKIDLVILDLIMPGMDGEKTFQRIREVRPGMPVILSSGYSINGKVKNLLQQGCNGFIQKPFTISELSRKIRKVLDGAKDPAHA